MAAAGTRSLTLTINAVDRTAQCSKTVITSGESDADFVSWADAAAGGAREYKLELEFVQDFATGTLWDLIYSSPGMTFPYLIRPYGNATATPAQPHFSGNVTITEPDGDFIGGEADPSVSARLLAECEWTCTGKPVRVTA